MELLLPLTAGACFAVPSKSDPDHKALFLARAYTSGQIFLFALFQPVFVFAILKNMTFSGAARIYLPLAIILSLAMAAVSFARNRSAYAKVLNGKAGKISFWGIASILAILFMIVMSFFMTYYDGDDSYYVAAAAQTETSDLMYMTEPYTGMAILSPYRYLFAPFPMWITLLAKCSGVKAVVMAHVLFPWSMILLSFSVMLIIAERIFEADYRKRDIFMFFASVLVLFGDYSIQTPENFLLARSRQGKAALASFVLPFLFSLILSAFREYDRNKKISARYPVLILFTSVAASLCSTMGGMLCAAFVCASMVCMMIAYRKIKVPVLMMLSSMPGLVFIAMYLVMR